MAVMDIYSTLLFLAGILTGLYASAVGGGAFVTLPLLLWTGLPTIVALGTNRICAFVLEITSAARYLTKNKGNLREGISLGVLVGAGAFVGSNIALGIPEFILNLIVAFSMVLMLGILARGVPKIEILGKTTLFYPLLFILGIYVGIVGAGFGAVMMILLVMRGESFVDGAATSRYIGMVGSLVAGAVFAINGIVDWNAAIALGSGLGIGAWWGAEIGISKGDSYIKWLLVVLIVVTIVKLIMDGFGIVG